MQTGSDVLQSGELSPHQRAFVTSATAVFMRQLCEEMFKVQTSTGSDNIKGIAMVCACRMLKTDKCAELERMVNDVISCPDGMPELENKELLSEVLQVYEGASQAERGNNGREFRRDVLVPALVEDAMRAISPTESESQNLLESVEQCSEEWNAFEPATPFQHIVVDCVNKIGI